MEMEAIKQIVRIPENHEIRIKIPQHLSESEIVEVLLIIKKKPNEFKQKMSKLKEAVKNNVYLDDVRDISEDFEAVDLEGWEQTNGI